VRFKRCVFRPKRPDLSERKLKLTERYIERERQAMGLFADFTEMPTAEQRIQAQTDSYNRWVVGFRQSRAAEWRRVRRFISELPVAVRDEVLAQWNAGKWPADPEYLVEFLMSKGIIARPEITTESMDYAAER